MLMSRVGRRTYVRAGLGLALGLCWAHLSLAQLEITEVMFDSLSSEPKWEWVEVRNTGISAVDLNGYVFDDDDGAILADSNISNLNGPTAIAPGGVAILYDGNSFGFDTQLYRDAWQNMAVPMIGVSPVPGLNNNGGDHVGLWPSHAAYMSDAADDGMGVLTIATFDAVDADFDYSTAPDGGAGVSGYWNGTGNYRDGANWLTSVDGMQGAVTSLEVTTIDAINSTDDVGNPGVVPAGPQAAGLLISEIMYNSRSTVGNTTEEWEWIEVVNNTGATIDFSDTNYFLDDVAGGALPEANIITGSIADGEVAILFNDSVAEADFTTAWGAGLNAIPVSAWSALNNTGDTVAIWDNSIDYNTDRMNDNFANAAVSIPYDDDGTVWPFDDGNGSIYQTNLSTDPTVGTNWLLSAAGDGISFNANPVGGTVIEHNGGDVGSPGSVPSGSTVIDPDFNDDGMINGADIDMLTLDIASMTNDVASFDLNGDGSVTYADVIQWLDDAGEANLPSMNPYLVGDSNLDGRVDGQDFVDWNDHKFTNTGKWTEADFTANGVTDGQDFVAWNDHKFMMSDGVMRRARTGLGSVARPAAGWMRLSQEKPPITFTKIRDLLLYRQPLAGGFLAPA